MKSVLLVLLGLIFFSACGERLPEGVVSRGKMEKILLDVHILDGRLSSMPMDSARATIDSQYEELFRFYEIDSTIFRTSVEYYSKYPTLLKNMYTRVHTVLTDELKKEQEKNQKIFDEQRLRDSIFHSKVQDSIRTAQKLVLKKRMMRDILFRHEADTTRDKPVPYTFDRSSIKFFEDLNLWKLEFGIRDTLMETFTDNDRWNSLGSPRKKADDLDLLKRDSLARLDSIKNLQMPRAILDPRNKNNTGLINPVQEY